MKIRKLDIGFDGVISSILAIGTPGIILVAWIAWTGMWSYAAVTALLAKLGGPILGTMILATSGLIAKLVAD